MEAIVDIIIGLGELFCLITPFTFTIGIINAIKKPKDEALIYIILAIVSAYLIFVPAIINWK